MNRGRESKDGGGDRRREAVSSVSLLEVHQGRRQRGDGGKNRGRNEAMSAVSDETECKNIGDEIIELKSKQSRWKTM